MEILNTTREQYLASLERGLYINIRVRFFHMSPQILGRHLDNYVAMDRCLQTLRTYTVEY